MGHGRDALTKQKPQLAANNKIKVNEGDNTVQNNNKKKQLFGNKEVEL